MSTFRGILPDRRAVAVTVDGASISDVSPIGADPSLPFLLPVLVDLQHNGSLGSYYVELDGTTGVARMREIATWLRRHGVGRTLVTLITEDAGVLDDCATFLGNTLDADEDLASQFFGVFHEGVYISPQEGWRGAHSPQWIRPPDFARVEELNALTGDRVRMVNVAPEEPGGLDFVKRAADAGMRVALGHCNPLPESITKAVERGATMVTHFGNGAAATIPRFDNPFRSFLDTEDLALGLICDGVHLPPELVRVALRCKGHANCIPVSDASGCAGLAPGEYDAAAGRRIEISAEGRVCLAGTDKLAGAWFQQDRSVEFLVQHAGFSFLDAWYQCSIVPAKFIRISLPRVDVGEEASFVLARWDEGVVIEQAVHRGVACLDSPTRPSDPAHTRPIIQDQAKMI